jgi:hypothetical protein
MIRAVLLALLAIPILVAMHILLVWQHLPGLGATVLDVPSDRYQVRSGLRCQWQVPARAVPSNCVTKPAPDERL